MFTELAPLLKHRVVMITVADVGDGVLRVNIIPKRLDADPDQNQVLTAPLSVTGSAEELDRELPNQLAAFTESVVRTSSNLEELKTQHAAAVKAVEAENRKRLDEKKKGSGAKSAGTAPATSTTPNANTAKPVFGSKAVSTTAECRSLFDVAGDTTGTAADEEPPSAKLAERPEVSA
jgi:PRTRC genetic system protein E